MFRIGVQGAWASVVKEWKEGFRAFSFGVAKLLNSDSSSLIGVWACDMQCQGDG